MGSPRERNESIEQPKKAPLCANNCGFFSNEASMGLCSKCYQEKQAREQQDAKDLDSNPSDRVSIIQQAEDIGQKSLSRNEISAEKSSIANSAVIPLKSKPTRCAECRKKVGLNGFKCKCGSIFCGHHRHADGHNCTFDHKKTEREYLTRQNPVVQGDKLDRLL